jgi:hypothetical protein
MAPAGNPVLGGFVAKDESGPAEDDVGRLVAFGVLARTSFLKMRIGIVLRE